MADNNKSPDQDSLMALEALLNIKNKCPEAKSTRKRKSNSLSTNNKTDARRRATPETKSETLANRFILPSPMGAYANHANSMQQRQPPSLGLPALAMVPSVVNYVVPFYPSNAHITQTPPTMEASNTPILPRKTAVSNPSAPAPAPAAASSQKAHPPPSLLVHEPKPTGLIRQGEIEAALHSKPQRGRKRDNLSLMERLELTRSRNREHAKSTRERKKARYQELLDNERKYESLKAVQELELKRRQSLAAFVKLRSQMLKNEEPFVDAEVSPAKAGTEKNSNTEELPVRLGLRDVLDDVGNFGFSLTDTTESNGSAETKSGMDALLTFDDRIQSAVSQQFGHCAISSLDVHVVNGRNGVALTLTDSGLVEWEVGFFNPCERKREVIMTGILRVSYAHETSKITSVNYSVLKNTTPQKKLCPASQKRQCPVVSCDRLAPSSSETFEGQVSHPSVISLDPPHVTDGQKHADGETATAREAPLILFG